MRRDVHLKALKAASNVAFSIALVGCASASPATTASTDDGTPATTSESELKKKHPKAHAGCHEDAGTPLDCQAVVDAAFPTAGDYPGTKQSVSEEVAACCDTLLGKGATGAGAHRWDCCANAAHPSDVGLACTPWGPPVPPAMREVA